MDERLENQRFEIRVPQQKVSFSAAHFIAYEGGESERLHGHNYRISARISGSRNEYGYVYDFVALGARIEELAGELDHRLLLPARSPWIDVQESGDSVQVTSGDRRYRFPRGDVVLLPVENTTTENLAAWAVDRLVESLPWSDVPEPETLTVLVEELPGQGAACTRRIGEAG